MRIGLNERMYFLKVFNNNEYCLKKYNCEICFITFSCLKYNVFNIVFVIVVTELIR
mgnify:CR=1 FL=1